jgi:hypothetical protein
MRLNLLSVRLLPMLLASAVALSACSDANLKPNPTSPEYSGMGGPGDKNTSRMGDNGSLLTLGVSKDQGNQGSGGGAGLGVNAFLWRGALDTLSFMPLVSADPFGGVIVTEWYQPQGAVGERFKATAYILSTELRSDALRVTMFRQVQQGGQWVDAPMSKDTVDEIENKVLSRARALKAQTATSG